MGSWVGERLKLAETVGMSQLVADTGLKPRALQEFCDIGILRPLPSTSKRGRGVHREFDASPPHYGERTIALVAAALHELHLPFGHIKVVVEGFRRWLGADDPTPDWGRRLSATPFGRALLGHYELVLVHFDEEGQVRWNWELIYSAEKEPQLEDVELMPTETGDELVSYDEPIQLKLSRDFLLGRRSGFVLNMWEILAPLRRK
jgi:hypothetical protein